MISVPSPFQPYRVLADEPTTLRCIISEQIWMQARFIVKILPRQPVAHHWPGLAGERGAQCQDVAPILARPELHNQPASGGELRIYLDASASASATSTAKPACPPVTHKSPAATGRKKWDLRPGTASPWRFHRGVLCWWRTVTRCRSCANSFIMLNRWLRGWRMCWFSGLNES